MKTLFTTLAVSVILTVSVDANAAVITWDDAVQIDDAGNFVEKTGSLVAAINSDTAGDDTSINGVNFSGTDVAGWNAGVQGAGGVTISSNASNGNFGSTFVQGSGPPPTITDSAINNLIGSGLWNPQTVTLTGLTPGDTYTIQIIGNDSRNGRDDSFETVLSDGVNDIATSLSNGTAGLNPLSNSAPTDGDPRLPGSAITGTFVADASTQTFELDGTRDGGASFSGGRAQINGFQLRTTPMVTAPMPFVHPGISHKLSDLERMKAMIEAEVEPWATSFQNLRNNNRARHDIVLGVVNQDPSYLIEFNAASDNWLINDSTTAYLNALMWFFTEDPRHAEKAIEVFNIYKTLRRNTEIPLVSGRIVRLIEAAEIIKHTYDGWDPVEMQEFADMLVYPGYSSTTIPQAAINSNDISFYWKVYNGDPSRIGNQGLLAARLLMSMGIFLDNDLMYQRAVRMLRGQVHHPDDVPFQSGPAINGNQIPTCDFYEQHELLGFESTIPDYGFNEVIGHYIYANGQCQEADRDQAHTLVGLSSINSNCEIAWNQGDDLFSTLNNRPLLGMEYAIRYNLSYELPFPDQPQPWEPTIASGEFMMHTVRNGRRVGLKINPGVNCNQSNLTRGFTTVRPVYELPLAHYRDRMGLPANDYKWLQRAHDYYDSSVGAEGITTTIAFQFYGSLFFRRVSPGDPINGFDQNGVPQFAMHTLPGTVEAENFDFFSDEADGEGRTYSDTTSGNTGFTYRFDSDVDIQQGSQGDTYIGQTADGEFLTYTINVPETGAYDIRARVSTPFAGASIKFLIDGVDQTGVVAVPITNGFEDWTNLTVARDVSLNQGIQQVRIDLGSGFTLDNFSITEASDAILGDCNLDGFVNFLDIAPLIGLLASGEYLEQADCNEDDSVNFLDIAPFISILTSS